MHTLILGGTGSAGQALIEQLRTIGPAVELTVVSRTATQVPGADRVLTGHYDDLIGSGELPRQLKRADAVVHLADGLSILQRRPFAGDGALSDRLIAASQRLAQAARDARVPLFVQVSSIKALCDEDDSRVLVETDESRATGLYGRSKLRLERAIAGATAGSDTRLVIVRNPVMYGAGKGGGSMHRLLRLADTGLPLPLGGIANRRSLLSLTNFASALAAILRAGRAAPGGVFHVHDGPALSTTEILATLRAALGRPRRLFPIGGAAAAMAGRAPLVGAAARRLCGSLELSDAEFRRAFQWAPVVETMAALAAMAKAFSAEPNAHAISAAAPSRT